MTLSKGRIKRIHVNQPNLRSNRSKGTALPEFTVQTSQGPLYGRKVQILGPSTLISSPCKPLHCGARVWIETKAEVILDV